MKKTSKFSVMARLIGLVKPLTGYMILAIIMGTVGHLCATFITVFGGYAILDLFSVSVPITMTTAFVCAVIFAVLVGVLRYAEQACNHYIAFKLLALIRDKVFRSLRRLCPAKLECKDKGNLISVITSDIELLEVFYAHTISPVMIAIIFSVVMCIIMSSYHWVLGAFAFVAYVVVGVIIPISISKLNGDYGMKFRTKSGEYSSFVLDSLRGLSEIIQYGKGKQRLETINNKTDELSDWEKEIKRLSGRNAAITNTVILFFDIAVLLVCGLLYYNGKVGFDGVLIPTILMMSSFGPVVALANLGSSLQYFFASGTRVLDILDETPEVEEVIGKEDIDFQGASAENITFSYGEETVLSDISVQIPKDKIIGIIGKSGSGKSTLLKLFMRFWNVQKGEINISNTNINNINTKNLRETESFVTQETHLFHDTIKNNLLIAKLDATDDEIIDACKKASVHKFIMSLPNGYDTQVGELGDTLSGGERQRIGLARAFLHNAPFMLFDEPTSNLDSLNEAVILKSLCEECKDKTVVLVSHRKSTMKVADKVYSVENGRVS